jgi:hypothetical protein
VKKVARQLLARVRAIVTVDWRMTAQARARVREAIEQASDDGLPRACTPDVFKTKRAPCSSTCMSTSVRLPEGPVSAGAKSLILG